MMRSIDDHGVSMTRAIFTQGRASYEYIAALEMSLLVVAAIATGTHLRQTPRAGQRRAQ